jgi:hypothetical protein
LLASVPSEYTLTIVHKIVQDKDFVNEREK